MKNLTEAFDIQSLEWAEELDDQSEQQCSQEFYDGEKISDELCKQLHALNWIESGGG